MSVNTIHASTQMLILTGQSSDLKKKKKQSSDQQLQRRPADSIKQLS